MFHLMKIMRKLRQSRELVGIDGEVKRPVHDVDVAPLGVKGNSCISGSLPSCFHVGQTDKKNEHLPHGNVCTCCIPSDRGGNREPSMVECSSGRQLPCTGRQPAPGVDQERNRCRARHQLSDKPGQGQASDSPTKHKKHA